MTAGPRFLESGSHTAHGGTVDYRLGKLNELGVVDGEWLDCGCADGYYTIALAERGAKRVVGVEALPQLVAEAASRPHPESVTFRHAFAEELPFVADSFDGAIVNEVLEHVTDEEAALSELRRVLRPGGHLALFSPNRWFPFEGHGARLDEERVLMSRPVPLMPWLPERLTRRFATARNYWPRELRALVTGAGFEIVESGWALAQFEQYPWLPRRTIEGYQRNVGKIERSPVARFLAVSTCIVACAR